MTLRDDLDAAVGRILEDDFTVVNRTTDVVPDPATMEYATGVRMEATFLYADLADSTKLIKTSPEKTIAAIMRSYLEVTVRIIRAHDGHIRSFDGDRVMGIFAGAGKEDRAVKSAMKIKYMVRYVLQPAMKKKYTSIQNSGWQVRAISGIATTDTTMVRVGIRHSSDLVSLGVAPNLAARLSERREGGNYDVFIGKGTHAALSDSMLLASDGRNMWDGPYKIKLGDKHYDYMRTNFWWKP